MCLTHTIQNCYSIRHILEKPMSTSHTNDFNSSSSADLCAQLDNILNTPFVPNRRFCVAEMLLLPTVIVFVVSILMRAFEGFNDIYSILIACLFGGVLLGLGVFGVYGFSRDKTPAQEGTIKDFISLSQKCIAIAPSLAPTLARVAHEMGNTHFDRWWININHFLQQFIDQNNAVAPVTFENQKQQFIDGLNGTDVPEKPREKNFFKL